MIAKIEVPSLCSIARSIRNELVAVKSSYVDGHKLRQSILEVSMQSSLLPNMCGWIAAMIQNGILVFQRCGAEVSVTYRALSTRA